MTTPNFWQSSDNDEQIHLVEST